MRFEGKVKIGFRFIGSKVCGLIMWADVSALMKLPVFIIEKHVRY